uniref:CUB domain-containing protein n=1 Tax=Caenorhabditis tropicalis TaxID=1561998 RepID=A0A1I7UAB5_9PELO
MAAQLFDNATALNISWTFPSFTSNQCPQFFPILVRHHKTDNRVVEVHGEEIMLGITETFRNDKHTEDEFMYGGETPNGGYVEFSSCGVDFEIQTRINGGKEVHELFNMRTKQRVPELIDIDDGVRYHKTK